VTELAEQPSLHDVLEATEDFLADFPALKQPPRHDLTIGDLNMIAGYSTKTPEEVCRDAIRWLGGGVRKRDLPQIDKEIARYIDRNHLDTPEAVELNRLLRPLDLEDKAVFTQPIADMPERFRSAADAYMAACHPKLEVANFTVAPADILGDWKRTNGAWQEAVSEQWSRLADAVNAQKGFPSNNERIIKIAQSFSEKVSASQGSHGIVTVCAQDYEKILADVKKMAPGAVIYQRTNDGGEIKILPSGVTVNLGGLVGGISYNVGRSSDPVEPSLIIPTIRDAENEFMRLTQQYNDYDSSFADGFSADDIEKQDIRRARLLNMATTFCGLARRGMRFPIGWEDLDPATRREAAAFLSELVTDGFLIPQRDY
jgi:hypothetical protein